jgi:DeoR/GlpR family transcriptional regulator of sugar metabolism
MWNSAEERRDLLLARLRERAGTSVTELSTYIGVSEVTIRKDLDLLESQGMLTRVHGGAVISSRGRVLLRVAEREQLQIEAKRRIAQAAIELIKPKQTLFFDSSTTALQIVRLLGGREDLTVITNGLYTAIEASAYPDITVIDVGGVVRPWSSSVIGNLTQDFIQRLHIDIAFLGARGVTSRLGLTELDLDEAQTKRQIVRVSDMVVCVADATKFGEDQAMSFALPHEIDRIITDQDAPNALVEELRALNIKVDVV